MRSIGWGTWIRTKTGGVQSLIASIVFVEQLASMLRLCRNEHALDGVQQLAVITAREQVPIAVIRHGDGGMPRVRSCTDFGKKPSPPCSRLLMHKLA